MKRIMMIFGLLTIIIGSDIIFMLSEINSEIFCSLKTEQNNQYVNGCQRSEAGGQIPMKCF